MSGRLLPPLRWDGTRGPNFPVTAFRNTFSAKRLSVAAGDGRHGVEFKQKVQIFLGSPKVPELQFGVEICWPRRIQLDNPSPSHSR